jgi:hypothetical protein
MQTHAGASSWSVPASAQTIAHPRPRHSARRTGADIPGAQPPAPEPVSRAWITARGVRSLRRKLELSQGDFGALVGVTANAALHMEKKAGALKVRQKTRAALLSLRGVGAKEARSKLAEIRNAKGRRAQKGKGRRARGRRIARV